MTGEEEEEECCGRVRDGVMVHNVDARDDTACDLETVRSSSCRGEYRNTFIPTYVYQLDYLGTLPYLHEYSTGS